MRTIQGKLVGTGLRFFLAVSRFNELISSRLLEGAKDFLLRHDVQPQDIDVAWVPGAWELPLAAREGALTGKYDAVIALGAIIRGDTPHFDFVASEVSKGLAMVELAGELRCSVGEETQVAHRARNLDLAGKGHGLAAIARLGFDEGIDALFQRHRQLFQPTSALAAGQC